MLLRFNNLWTIKTIGDICDIISENVNVNLLNVIRLAFYNTVLYQY